MAGAAPAPTGHADARVAAFGNYARGGATGYLSVNPRFELFLDTDRLTRA